MGIDSEILISSQPLVEPKFRHVYSVMSHAGCEMTIFCVLMSMSCFQQVDHLVKARLAS